jgi:prolyl-tRNA editing enzyme YbaK/EbsC (Cys-tRNA(Pro) deacylase)
MHALASRWGAIEARLAALEGGAPAPGARAPAAGAAMPASDAGDGSPVRARLAAELESRSVPHAFKRVFADYYDRELPSRAAELGEESVDGLCKTLCLKNTAFRPSPSLSLPAGDPLRSQHILVVAQYCARFDAERLKKGLLASAGGRVPAKAVNFRLAPEAESAALTGYEHNAVTPVGCATRLPVVLSAEVADRPHFWLGGGEVDLKLAVATASFVKAYGAVVLDVTHGSGEGGEEAA